MATMPPATRRDTPSSTADDEPGTAGRNGTDDATASAQRTAGKAAAKTERAADEAVDDTAAAGTGAAGSLRQILTMPATVARQVADDVVTTVQRPDAVLYLGGLVGLAVVGVLEWPVVAAAGVGVAVAGGVRRARG